jgi:hypothetical protein
MGTSIANSITTLRQAMCCPITGEPFRDPVIIMPPATADENTVSYERSALLERVSNGDLTDPTTGQPLPDNFWLVPNTALCGLVEQAVRVGLLNHTE